MEDAVPAILGLIFGLIYLVVIVGLLIGMWKVYAKAGKPGWAALVPIYNFIVLIQISGRPLWWIVLMFIPCVSIFAYLFVCIDIAKAFGKGAGFGVGLCFLAPIFFPILGFGSAVYQGADTQE
jgi:hypothetical protein